MGSISERERILLGYAPYDSVGSLVARSQLRNSDVDFLDVFGGPPRRSSLYENRRSRGDSIDSYSRPNRGREESVGSHRSRLGSGDKPVFGDGGTSGRIQQLGDDFYGDIFQISESSCSSPRGGDRDPLMSSPTSKISSPNIPTSPLLEPLFGGSSLPMHSSLLETMGKGLDHPSFGSPSEHFVYKSEDGGFEAFSHSLSPNASYSGFSPKQSVVGSGDLKNYGYGSYRQSPLSRPSPRGFEGFLEATEPALQKVESQIGKSSSSIEDYINNRQFHFSIYKWAGKGVMLVMPSDSNEGNELEGLMRLPEVIVQELELQTQDDYLSPLIKPSKSGTVILENKSDIADDYAGTSTKISHAKSSLEGDTNKTSDKYGKQSEKDSDSDFDKISSTNSTVGKQNPEFWINAHNEPNPELKSLSQLFNNETEKQRSSDIFRQVKEKETLSKSQKKQQLQRENKLVPGEDNSTNLHDIPSISDDKPRGSKIKGKVKEFIKKFNQDAPPKWKGAFEILNRRSKVEDSRQDNADALTHASFTGSDEMHEGSGNKSIPLFDIRQVMEYQLIEKTEEKSSIFYSDPIMDDPPSEERVEVLHSQYEPPLEELNNTTWYEEIIHEDIEEFLVQQLPIDQIEGSLSGSQQDQIKDLDANIRQWSKGKEGNIRSLLSTLQLVLWPESGWKQVPLVNIIEGPSVKKAYQKALLCLHPDKLQQKGASSNQKYIAEKVFDILQEAWDLFNSVSQF